MLYHRASGEGLSISQAFSEGAGPGVPGAKDDAGPMNVVSYFQHYGVVREDEAEPEAERQADVEEGARDRAEAALQEERARDRGEADLKEERARHRGEAVVKSKAERHRERKNIDFSAPTVSSMRTVLLTKEVR